jgi:hypothetical protein
MRPIIQLAAVVCIAIAVHADAAEPGAERAAPAKTEVRDAGARNKLLGKRRLSLQWIGWNQFGTLHATDVNGLIRLKGEQKSRTNGDFLRIDGVVTMIDAEEFKFLGTIVREVDMPDRGGIRPCVRNGLMKFAITQNRKYWRLREPHMESCDGVADYIDIYF